MATERKRSPRVLPYVRDGAAHVTELQRSRLMSAAVGAVHEFGYNDVSVTRITSRARVSRRTFYELFDNREECLVAVLESAVDRIATELAAAKLDELSWASRVRIGLFTILSFFDREPVLARVCVIEAARGGTAVLERRAAVLARLAEAIDEGRGESRNGEECTPTTAEGVVGAAFAIVHGRLWRGEAGPLTDLFAELLGIILLPYLGSAATRREQKRPLPAAPAFNAGPHTPPAHVVDPLQGLPMRLTYRTARVLEAVSEHPGLSNRQVGERAGIEDQGQVSKLLARLMRLGLLGNGGPGHLRGEANVWTLTSTGRQIAESIRAHRPASSVDQRS